MADDEQSYTDAIMGSPFSLAAEDLCRHYVWQYWLSTGDFPYFEELRQRIKDTDWFQRNNHKWPGTPRIAQVYKECMKQIC